MRENKDALLTVEELAETENFRNGLRVPLIVGVSGHIDVDETANNIADALGRFWRKLYDLAGKDTPVILLTSIAAGADHYMVKYRPPNVKYCVVLPFAEAEYRRDFTGQALKDFEEDLHGAYNVVNCGAVRGDYTQASDYVRKHSDVLLTMWDGYANLDRNKMVEKGGTYYQIRMAFGMDDLLLRHQEKYHLIVNLYVERSKKGILYHQEHHDVRICRFQEPGCLQVLECSGENENLEKHIEVGCDFLNWKCKPEKTDIQLERISGFSDVLNFIRKHNKDVQSAVLVKNYYLRYKMGPRCKIEDDEKSWKVWQERGDRQQTARKRMLEIVRDDFYRHEYFDNIAAAHQMPHSRQFLIIALFSFILGILGQAWGDLTFHPDDTVHECIIHCIIGLYLIGWLFTFLYWKIIVERKNHYEQYLQPRVIAELMRLKIFWKLADIRESFTDTMLEDRADCWFSLLVCNWEQAEKRLSDQEARWLNDGNGSEAVLECWLNDQISYYNGYLLPRDSFSSAQKKKCPFLPSCFQRYYDCICTYIQRCYGIIRTYENEKCRKKTFLFPSWFREYFKKYERNEEYAKMVKNFFFGLSFFFALLLLIVFLSVKDHQHFLYLECYREFLVGICPFIVTTLGWILEKNRWDSMSRQYRIMLCLFEKTKGCMQSSDNPDSKRQVIKELMQYASQENAEWKSIRNDSKPTPMI